MKKLIILLCFVGLINAVNAQQATGDANAQAPSAVSVTGKECKGISKDCVQPCSANDKKCESHKKDCASHCSLSQTSSAGNMSSESSNAGAVSSNTTATTTAHKKAMKHKSCCKGMSKASALNVTVAQPQPVPAEDAVPK